MGDGKCPDIYECRLGVNKIMRENLELKKKVRYAQVELCRSRAQIKLLKAKLEVAKTELHAQQTQGSE